MASAAPAASSPCRHGSSRRRGSPDVVAVPVGAFADPGFPPPRRCVYEERRHSWVQLPPDVEHYD